MPRNANQGTTALHAFVELTEAFERDGTISLGELQDKLKSKLGKYLTDGRTRSTRRAINTLSRYGIIHKDLSKFGEPLYSLTEMEDPYGSVIYCVLVFLFDMATNLKDPEAILERVENFIPQAATAMEEYLPSEYNFGDIFTSYLLERSKVTGLPPFTLSTIFHGMPVIFRVHTLLMWLKYVSTEKCKHETNTIIMKMFYKICGGSVKGLPLLNTGKELVDPSAYDNTYKIDENFSDVEIDGWHIISFQMIPGEASKYLPEIVRKSLGIEED